jgi:hypothetical protein
MGRILSTEEALQDYRRAMGEELGERFYDLWQDISWLHMHWAEYVVMFGTNPERIDLLNRAASGFACMLDGMMWERTMIHITRLLDRPKDGKQQRASLRALPGLVDLGIKEEVNGQVQLISGLARFSWQWRDGYIAHRDLDLALNRGANPLPVGSRAKVQAVLASMRDLMNLIARHYGMVDTAFDLASPYHGADSLLHTIRLGVMMDDRRQAQMERGEQPDGGYCLPGI